MRRTTGLRRTGRLRPRSQRMERTYRERRLLVAALLDAHPMCQRCGQARSTEVHEVLSRARGGSILDPDNCVALCHDCHAWVTTHPAQALAAGWLRSSWDLEPPMPNT